MYVQPFFLITITILSLPTPTLRPPDLHPTRPFTQGAERAFLFTSGMAALATVTHLLSHGDHIVAGDDLYGGTSRLLARVCPAAGLEVTNVDTCDVECVASGGSSL